MGHVTVLWTVCEECVPLLAPLPRWRRAPLAVPEVGGLVSEGNKLSHREREHSQVLRSDASGEDHTEHHRIGHDKIEIFEGTK